MRPVLSISPPAWAWMLVVALVGSTIGATAQERPRRLFAPGYETRPDTTRPANPSGGAGGLIQLDLSTLPASAQEPVQRLNVKGADLRDVLRALAQEHGLNLIVADDVGAQVTVRFHDIPVIDVLVFLAEEYGLELRQTGTLFRIRRSPTPLPLPAAIETHVAADTLSADLAGEEVRDVLRQLAEQSGHNLVTRPGVEGPVHGFIQRLPFAHGLRTLLENNGFTLSQEDGVFYVGRAEVNAEGQVRALGTGVTVDDEGRIRLDLRDADVADAVHLLAERAGVDVITYQQPQHRLTASVGGLTLDEAMAYLLKGTTLGFRREEGRLIIGDRSQHGVHSTRLVRLRHARPEALLRHLPDALRAAVTVQPVPEQNALVLLGPTDRVRDLEAVIEALDHPTPQVLIEALVVDFDYTDLSELGVQFDFASDGTVAAEQYGFGGGEAGGAEVSGNGHTLNWYIDFLADLAGIGSIGQLPANFYFKVQALEREGYARVRSRPQIATLSGHTANISVGTTQYYVLRSLYPIPSPGGGVTGEVEQFEQVEANVSLEITPWVSASGDVTAEIKPRFATPVGVLNADVPPTINSREVNTTVRLRDGQTIIIGGLIQESQSEVEERVPFLGAIPLLGRLFRSTRVDKRTSELVVFITPHVFYGDGRDSTRWRRYMDGLDPDLLDFANPPKR